MKKYIEVIINPSTTEAAIGWHDELPAVIVHQGEFAIWEEQLPEEQLKFWPDGVALFAVVEAVVRRMQKSQ